MDSKMNASKILGGIKSLEKTDTEFLIIYNTGESAKLNILNDHVFKYFMSPSGEFPSYPTPRNSGDKAKINSKEIADYGLDAFQKSSIQEIDETYIINTERIQIKFDKTNGIMGVLYKGGDKYVFNEQKPLCYLHGNSTQTLYQYDDEYFYGGGMQNGRFSHKEEIIEISNTTVWVDGGVASPCPFYWSSYGYGVLRNTWQSGKYDFRSISKEIKTIRTTHDGEDFDAFYFINPRPQDILKDYYELTGQPIVMPQYAFYEAHLNAFCGDYWRKVDSKTPGAVLFEDGQYYKCYQRHELYDITPIRMSLNGDDSNYQFSARAMVDRYRKHDMPLGWFIPNDGFDSSYGKTNSFEGDLKNLKDFTDYAKSKGVEVAVWNKLKLRPRNCENPMKGERDLAKEVGVAGVVGMKLRCGDAWTGTGYSFGLNSIEDATKIFEKAAQQKVRPFIVTIDGWAGTQRYAGIWSGDQVGGTWENIRFQIPSYVGAGMSGLPVVGSDMDGMHAGKDREVYIRDYQWKSFTPLQLNNDGCGDIPKTPFSLDDEATSINRAYLKLKSMLMPYNCTIGHESINGPPMVRAMLFDFPYECCAYTDDSKYQFMWGPNLLVAPIFNKKRVMDASIRDGIYLPFRYQVWIDFFTGEKYQGGKILNNFKSPLWKIPLFVRDGSIIPMTNPNNNPNEIDSHNRIFNIYPNGESSFELYEDDGISSDYLRGLFATTKIDVIAPVTNEKGDIFITIDQTKGSYKKMVNERSTVLRILTSQNVEKVKVTIKGESVEMLQVDTEKDFYMKDNVYYFKKDFAINPYLNVLGGEVWNQKFLLVKVQKTDVTSNEIQVIIKDFHNCSKIYGSNTEINHSLSAPSDLSVFTIMPTSIAVNWKPVKEALYYEIERDATVFSNITGTSFTFDGFKSDTRHCFRIRSVDEKGVSEWSLPIHGETTNTQKVIKVAKVTCSVPCQPGHEVGNLIDGDEKSTWHTKWGLSDQVSPYTESKITLTFDLGDVYCVEKVEYVPREDGGTGTFIELSYRHSVNGKDWSKPLYKMWECNTITKEMELLRCNMRYVEFNITDTFGGYGSGRQFLFYYSRIVTGVKATCSVPSEPGEAITKLTDGETCHMWHTRWNMPNLTDSCTGKFIRINFDLRDIYEISKLEYLPRDDGCPNGIFEEVQYTYSIDNVNWSPMSDVIEWDLDDETKTINLNGARFRFFELRVLQSGRGFASGRQVFFYKTNADIGPTSVTEDHYKHMIKEVRVWCSVPCEDGKEVNLLTDTEIECEDIWLTSLALPLQVDPDTGKIIRLNFDLRRIYVIEKMEYHPRSHGNEGIFLKIRYRYSIDGNFEGPFSEHIYLNNDNTVKTIMLHGAKMRFIEIQVLDSESGVGSGRKMLFFGSDPKNDYSSSYSSSDEVSEDSFILCNLD